MSKRLDLNLFLVLDAVMIEKSVTRAADTLAMSQPAVSNALNRARHILDDRLFVKSVHGVSPTPYMTTIWPEMHRMIEACQGLVEGYQFDPKKMRGNFRISMSDSLARRVIPDLIRSVVELSPMTCIQVVLHSNSGSAKEVQQGTLDCAVGTFPVLPSELNVQVIAVDEMVCILRRGHPLAGKLAPKTYAAAGHVFITPSGRNQGFVDTPLSRHNERRRAVALVSNYFDAIEIVASTDFLASVPSHCISADLASRFNIVTEQLPFETDKLQYKMIWHNRLNYDAGHVWFRKLIQDIVCKVEGQGVMQ